MAVINFLFGNRTPSGFALEGVVSFEADLTISEDHERIADVTENPVETGGTVSDHIILQPERVRLEGFVTDTPAAVFAADNGRTQDAFALLEEAWSARELVNIVTGRRTYEDMVITRLNLPRNRPASMSFSLEAQHVTIVETETGELPATQPDTEDGQATQNLAAPEQDRGRQATRESSENTQTRSRSTLRDFTDYLRGRGE